MLPGNTADCTTLRDVLRRIEAQYGKAQRIWVMDRGIPTEGGSSLPNKSRKRRWLRLC